MPGPIQYLEVDGRMAHVAFLDKLGGKVVEQGADDAHVMIANFDDGSSMILTAVSPTGRPVEPDVLALLEAELGLEVRVAGDYEGHPFRGNQYTTGTGGTISNDWGNASKDHVAYVLKDHELADVASSMLSGVPGDLAVTWTSSREAGAAHVTLTARRTAAGQDLLIQRTFVRDEATDKLYVVHDKFELNEADQGKGTAKKVLGDSYELYKRLGVDEIEVGANMQAGAYAWARFGFTAKQPKNLAADVKAVVTERLTAEQADDVRSILTWHGSDPKLPWHLAGLRGEDGTNLGKPLLKDLGWVGKLDMHDAVATKRFEHYLSTGAKGDAFEHQIGRKKVVKEESLAPDDPFAALKKQIAEQRKQRG